MKTKQELINKLGSILEKVEEIEKTVNKQNTEIESLKNSHVALYEELHRKKQYIDKLKGKSTEVASDE